MRLRVDQIVQDARFGLRQLRRSPLVAVAAIVTLAIGIGLNTAVFSLVHAVLLRPLPYPHGERLVWIAPYSERWRMETQASRGDYLVWKQHTDVFERMAAYGTQDLNLIVGGEPSQERIASIGGDFWDITGARPLFGHLMPEDDEQGILSGTIVGVAHDFANARLDGDVGAELYYPWQRAPTVQSIAVAVRMSESAVPGVRSLIESVDRTQPVYQFQRLEQSLSASVAPRRFNMLLLELYAGTAVILALVGTFGVVARSVSRRTRETAVRIAIGARPAAVMLMIVRQAMVYVLVGIGVGVAATFGAGRVMSGLLYGVEPHDPPTIALIAIGVAAAAFIACCVPASRAARVEPVVALRQD